MDKEYVERDMVLSHKWKVRSYDPSDPDPVTEVVSVSSIMQIHAADVVEVVRCKQCKHCVEHYDTDGNVPYWTCKEWDSGTDYDGYCHYGERKDGGRDE